MMDFNMLNISVLHIFFSNFYFICFWLPRVFIAEWGLSLAAASRGCSLLQRAGLSCGVFCRGAQSLDMQASGAPARGLSSCDLQAQ